LLSDRLLEFDFPDRCRRTFAATTPSRPRRAACPYLATHLGAYWLLRGLSVGPSCCHSRATPASQCQAAKYGRMTPPFTKRSVLALSGEQPTPCPPSARPAARTRSAGRS